MPYDRNRPRQTALTLIRGMEKDFEWMFEDDLHDEGFTEDEIQAVRAEFKRIIKELK